ncbi:MAG: polyphosphate polymerase domain-containing protein [Planctomycetes bacterium]|nr:polyphosphate polymerase domain-containing protein [Planctomycetota bacterium]
MSLPVGSAQRHECKYVITESEALRISAEVRPFVRPDPHAAGRPGHTYPISSLYLDGGGFPLYHETVEGKKDRFKLRVRAYSDRPEDPVFLEIKRRANGVVRKTRCKVPRALLPALLSGRTAALAEVPGAGRPAAQEFVALLLRTQARPTVLVRYDREAYVGLDDTETRVTFDRHLRVLRTERPEVLVDAPGFAVVQDHRVVLELKFNHRCPNWMQHLIQGHGLRRTSFSKYCHSLNRAAAPQRLVTH